MPALAPIFITALAFALLMIAVLVLLCIIAPEEEELWPGEEARSAAEVDMQEEQRLAAQRPPLRAGLCLDSGEFIPADELNAQQEPRRAGLRIVRN